VPIDTELHSKILFFTSERQFNELYAFNSVIYYDSLSGLPINTNIDIKNSGLLQATHEDEKIKAGLIDEVFRGHTFYAQPAFSQIIVEDLLQNQNIPDGIGSDGVTLNLY